MSSNYGPVIVDNEKIDITGAQLTEIEQDLLAALTGKFVCTKVLETRSCILKGRKPMSKQDRELVLSACNKLVRLGLASRQDARNTIWWRLADVIESE